MTAESTPTEQKQDWFLIGILIGIVALVVTTVVLVLRQDEQTYLSEEVPENIAYNYFFALSSGENERAYEYLAKSIPQKPETLYQFTDEVASMWRCSGESRNYRSYSIVTAEEVDDRIKVTMGETTYYGRGDIFSNSSRYREEFTVWLVEEPAGWRIIDSDQCWGYSWNQPVESTEMENENG